jgi:protein-L-isoaspartate(D-aspartate) O-methyltransferase
MSAEAPRESLARSVRALIRDPRVRDAFLDVPRELYVAEDCRAYAWDDRSLPLAEGATISQPTLVALMTAALEPEDYDTMLDVGTGSGYQAAVLARLVRRVFAIELRASLAHRARANLRADCGVRARVELVIGDAWSGFPGRVRFDGIVVAAAVPRIPPALVEQLAAGGRLLAPVGPPGHQELVRLRRRADGSAAQERLGGCAFVPLVEGGRR